MDARQVATPRRQIRDYDGELSRLRIVACIATYQASNQRPPTVEDICAGTGISSTGAAHYHIQRLVASGILRNDGTARGLFIVAPGAVP